MTVKRKMIVNVLATIAFVFLFLLPIIGFMATEAGAGETAETASYTDDYVFFVVQNDDVPLAAAPSTGTSSYILWTAAICLLVIVAFMYSAWYLSIRRNTWELSGKLSPVNRRALKLSSGFLHPIRAYRLSKETEASVASMYISKYL